MKALRYKWIAGVLALAVAIYTAYDMSQLPFWGYRPLALLISAYLVLWLPIEQWLLPVKNRFQLWFLSSLTAVLLSMGYPDLPLTPVLFVAWLPLWTAWKRLEGVKRKGWKLFFLAFHSFFLWNILVTWWVANTALVAGVAANVTNSLIMAAVICMADRVARRYPASWTIPVFIAFWLVYEWAHYHWEISWPWLTLGNAFAEMPWMVQWYSWTGVFGGSLWVLLVNHLLFDSQSKWGFTNSSKKISKAIITLVTLTMISLVMLWQKEPDGEKRSVLLVQPNYDPHYEKFEVPQSQQLRRFVSLIMPALDQSTDYLVMPETSFLFRDFDRLKSTEVYRTFASIRDSFPNLKIVMGMDAFRRYDKDDPTKEWIRTHVRSNGDTIFYSTMNAAIALHSSIDELPLYIKSKLVPGVEIFPYRKFLFFIRPLIDYLGGTLSVLETPERPGVFHFEEDTVAPVICYESVFGELHRHYVIQGAEAFFIITNDGWWDNTPGHRQHLKMGALRAIEFKREIGRAANTGVSAFIDRKGKIHSPTNYGEATVLKGEITFSDQRTVYSRFGDVIPRTALLCTFLLILGLFIKKD